MCRSEMRKSPRIKTRITIESVGPTLVISAEGMVVLIVHPMQVGSTPSLSFTLPDDERRISCKGRVSWCRTSKIDPDLFEVGLGFRDISDEDRQGIADYVAKHNL